MSSTEQPDLPMAGIVSETLCERAQRVYGIRVELTPVYRFEGADPVDEPDWLASWGDGNEHHAERGYTPEDAAKALCVRMGLPWPPSDRGAR